MIYWLTAPLTLFIVILQIAAAPSFTYLGVHADLPVVWLGCWAAVRGHKDLLPLIAVAGLGLGLLGREPLGASLLALLPIAILATLDDLRVVPGGFARALLIVFVGGLFYAAVHAVASFAGGEALGSPLNVLRVAPRAAAFDALTAALWYWPLRLSAGRQSRAGDFRRA